MGKLELFAIFITILLSKADFDCIDTTSLTQDGIYLENSLCGVTSASSIIECVADCFSCSDCLSFGFEPASRRCHLHAQISAAPTVEMTEKKNWLHSNIDKWPETLFGPCQNHTCQKGKVCRVHRVTAAPVCVKAYVPLTPGYCPVPVDIPDASISSGKQETGSVRTYTCNHGYTLAVTTCNADGEWRKVQLNCSGPLGQKCNKNADCTVSGSVCFEGVCLCKVGVYFSPGQNTCVRRCTTYGKAMDVYKGVGIRRNNNLGCSRPNLASCVETCVEEKTFTCVTVEFNPSSHECLLSESGYLDVYFWERVPSPGWTLNQRQCI